MELKIKKVNKNAKIPFRATKGSAGMDLCACIDAPLTLAGGETAVIPTGIAISLPSEEMGAFVFARSGLAIKHGIGLLNSVGVIDSDYRGEVTVAIHNHGTETACIEAGERIAQLLIGPVATPGFEAAEVLSDTERGAGGFGSTGRT